MGRTDRVERIEAPKQVSEHGAPTTGWATVNAAASCLSKAETEIKAAMWLLERARLTRRWHLESKRIAGIQLIGARSQMEDLASQLRQMAENIEQDARDEFIQNG